MREPFILYRRPDGARAGKCFSVAFWDNDQKKYVSRRSVAALLEEVSGSIPSGTSPLTKAGARRIVEAWLEDHSPAPIRGQPLMIHAYLSSFWDDDGKYALAKKARGRAVSSAYLYNSRRLILNYVIPFLNDKAPNLPLTHVTTSLIEDIVMSVLHEGKVSARTVNTIRQAIAVPLTEAQRLGLIKENPAQHSPKLAETTTTRGVLTLAEARLVLAAPWSSARAHAASLLAATTGMRLGEVRGLQVSAIDDSEIEIRQSWANREGLKDPKWGSKRTVPVPASVAALLRKVARDNPWNDDFVFYGFHKGKPLGNKEIREGLSKALLSIGIDSDRGVTFHSWRHFYNSQMRDRIPDHALRQLTGHKSEQMTERYTHITQETRAAAASLVETILIDATRI